MRTTHYTFYNFILLQVETDALIDLSDTFYDGDGSEFVVDDDKEELEEVEEDDEGEDEDEDKDECVL